MESQQLPTLYFLDTRGEHKFSIVEYIYIIYKKE